MRGWRQHRGLTQREAARSAGISQSAWCQYESGERVPNDAAVIERLIKATGEKPRFALSLSMIVAAQKRLGRGKQRDEGATGTDD